MPPVPAVSRRNYWILNSWRDLVFYVGTPLLLIPVFTLAQGRWSAQDIYLFVAAFGATGHHLPGMIRAYGDKALFRRFRWRFIFAPVFLIAVCATFYFWDLKAIILVLFFWGVWHGMMQTYGFCRIYDAKTGSFAAFTRRLDFALCLAWFAAGVFLSSQRMTDTLGVYYSCGGAFISPAFLRGAQTALLVAALAVTILFIGNFTWGWKAGRRANPVKIALLTTSIAFWWYCNNGVTNILAGIALFEVFHDVQYLSLVWIYNRNRVEKDNSIGGFMRFVFRRSGSLLGLYIGLVFAYGSFAYFNSQVQIENLKRILTGVVTASALLHFYYDGFIWKVRESSTRQSLGLSGGTAESQPQGIFHGWMLHGLKWVACFVVPIAALCVWQLHGSISSLQRAEWVVADLPKGARQHYEYGAELQRDGQMEAAAREFNIALQFQPSDAKAHYNLALILQNQSKFEPAAAQYEMALPLDPKNADLHYDYAYTLERLGRRAEATAQIDAAIQANPNFTPALYKHGLDAISQGKWDDGIYSLQQVVKNKPDFVDARFRLANALLTRGDLDQARAEFQNLLKLTPNRADAVNALGVVFLRSGQTSQAIVQFDQAIKLDPNFLEAAENLRIARARDSRFH